MLRLYRPYRGDYFDLSLYSGFPCVVLFRA
nr:MAG TPA: hypothetical protein [Caudoviricetes sp.]